LEFCCLFRDTEKGIALPTTSDGADLHQRKVSVTYIAFVDLVPKLHLKSSPKSRKLSPQT
jgi:hypothetical protein